MSQETQQIDMMQYGVLWQRVQDMDKKIDKMESQLEELVNLANQSRGAVWVGMSLASIAGGLVGWVFSFFKGA
jgi:hypothetical protein